MIEANPSVLLPRIFHFFDNYVNEKSTICMKVRGLLIFNDVDEVVDPPSAAISAFADHRKTEVEQKIGKHGAEEGRRKRQRRIVETKAGPINVRDGASKRGGRARRDGGGRRERGSAARRRPDSMHKNETGEREDYNINEGTLPSFLPAPSASSTRLPRR